MGDRKGEPLIGDAELDEWIQPWVRIEPADFHEEVADPENHSRARIWAAGWAPHAGGTGSGTLYLCKLQDFRDAGQLVEDGERREKRKRYREDVREHIGLLKTFLGVGLPPQSFGKALRQGEIPAGYELIGPHRRSVSRWSSVFTDMAEKRLSDVIMTALDLMGWFFRVERYELHEVHSRRPHHDPMMENLWRQGEGEFWPLDAATQAHGVWEKVYLDDPRALRERYGEAAVGLYLDWWTQHARIEDGRPYLTDAELAMFEQANSEHCRHHIFNATWKDEKGVPVGNGSLFDAIRSTSQEGRGYREGLISCYSDNAAVFTGHGGWRFQPLDTRYDGSIGGGLGPPGIWEPEAKSLHLVAKAETHNHPTGISPWPGAATGVGGEIRDEAAVGRGGASKAGVSAYVVSDLGLGNWYERREQNEWRELSPEGALFAGPRMIMCDGPLGAARYGNEFGRPQLAGAFRTLELRRNGKLYGYDKPLMLAGGVGNVEPEAACKDPMGKEFKGAKVAGGDLVVVLGGPAMRIGLGGGAASSKASDGEDAFASVQRAGPEMQRRCQQVIDTCRHSDSNPILLIHDVGAGGLANAIPELLRDAGMGLHFDFGLIPLAQRNMSALEIWCNESQERYVLVVQAGEKDKFERICKFEECPFTQLGELEAGSDRLHSLHPPQLTIGNRRLHGKRVEEEKQREDTALNVSLGFLFGDFEQPARLLPQAPVLKLDAGGSDGLFELTARAIAGDEPLTHLALQVLAHPAVASKAFLIHIADRNVGGLTVRDQLVGPLQMPVADCATTLASHFSADLEGDGTREDKVDGEALAMGERPALALTSPEASVRMALGEAVTNIAAAPVAKTSDIRLSANWMAACREPKGEGSLAQGSESGHWEGDRALYDGVHALSAACRELGIAIPVGKDSLFMASDAWRKHGSWIPERKGNPERVVAPMTAVLTAFAAIGGVDKAATPLLDLERPSCLVRIGLSGNSRLGGSIWEQLARAEAPDEVEALSLAPPDLDDLEALPKFLEILGWLRERQSLLAYHDISDGGLLACLVEMAFASSASLEIAAPAQVQSKADLAVWILNEELGAVVQIPSPLSGAFQKEVEGRGLVYEELGRCCPGELAQGFSLKVETSSGAWQLPLWPSAEEREGGDDSSALRAWSHTSNRIRLSRGDDQISVREEYSALVEGKTRLTPKCPDVVMRQEKCAARRGGWAGRKKRPRVGILRANGSNGQAEMAAAFYRAGLEPVDLHMNDLRLYNRRHRSYTLGGPHVRAKLGEFSALAFVGGFSYGDVLGAGGGWWWDVATSSGEDENPNCEEEATSGKLLPNKYYPIHSEFRDFFEDESKLALGICNGCQVLSRIRDLIPGTQDGWPDFVSNASQRHEARLVQTLIDPDVARGHPWLRGLGGAVLPVAVSHGEGRAVFSDRVAHEAIAMRYCAADHSTKDVPYPANPNGSEGAVAAVSAANGRVLAMMPHPERSLRNLQFSWCPEDWDPLAPSPWQQMFNNAADWLRERK